MKLLKRSTPQENFWSWFSRHSDDYFRLNESNLEALFDELEIRLRKINDDLTFEFSADSHDGKREFIISADGIRSAFDDVVQLVESAPDLGKWEIIAFRQRTGQSVIQINNIVLSVDDVFFDWERTGDGTLNLKLFIDQNREDNHDYITAMYLLLDSLLGEYDVEMYIEHIARFSLEGYDRRALIPLAQLPLIVDRETKQ